MKLIIIFTIFARIAFAAEESDAFVADVPTNPVYIFSERIINGQNANSTLIPWHASILMSKTVNGKPTDLCGGAIISNLYVLTAAHCCATYKSFNLGFGSVNLNLPSVVMTSLIAYVHPKYNKTTFANDAGIIKLPKRLTFSATIKAIRLPKLSQNTVTSFVPVTCMAAGFGKTSDANPAISLVLKWIEFKTINNTQCAKMYIPGIVIASTICTLDNSARRKNVCNGDSGGALAYKESGTYTHVGITSFVSSRGCELNYPAGYTRTASCLQWIGNVTQILLRP